MLTRNKNVFTIGKILFIFVIKEKNKKMGDLGWTYVI